MAASQITLTREQELNYKHSLKSNEHSLRSLPICYERNNVLYITTATRCRYVCYAFFKLFNATTRAYFDCLSPSPSLLNEIVVVRSM